MSIQRFLQVSHNYFHRFKKLRCCEKYTIAQITADKTQFRTICRLFFSSKKNVLVLHYIQIIKSNFTLYLQVFIQI